MLPSLEVQASTLDQTLGSFTKNIPKYKPKIYTEE